MNSVLTMIFYWNEEQLRAKTGIMLHVIREAINRTFMLLPAAEQNWFSLYNLDGDFNGLQVIKQFLGYLGRWSTIDTWDSVRFKLLKK